jgi:hypothetical protein
MDLNTSIAQLSMDMSAVKFQNQLSTSVLKKTLDVTSELASSQLDMLDNSSAVAFSGDIGAIFDARA